MFRQIPRIVLFLFLLAANIFASDWSATNWKSSVDLRLAPVSSMEFRESRAFQNSNESAMPLGIQFSFNPFHTPLGRLDLPFDLWMGLGIDSWSSVTLHESGSPSEKLQYTYLVPESILEVQVNLWKNLDLRVGGIYGLAIDRFDHTFGLEEQSEQGIQTQVAWKISLSWASWKISEFNTLQTGLYFRQETRDSRNLLAVSASAGSSDGVSPALRGLNYSLVSHTAPTIGFEVTLQHGRESRIERLARHRYEERARIMRNNFAAANGPDEKECREIQNRYRFYIDDDGKLPDVRHSMTRKEFNSGLKRYLAWCRSDDAKTRKLLFLALDSSQQALDDYLARLEEKRYRSTLASASILLHKKFLEYYADGPWIDSLQISLDKLVDKEDFLKAQRANSIPNFLAYMKKFGKQGQYYDMAETGIFTLVRESHKIRDYRKYLKRFPRGQYVDAAQKAIAQLKRLYSKPGIIR